MKVIVGTTNSVKLEAVKEVLKDYELFKDSLVTGLNVSSDVSNQPLSLEEIILGAKNRAKNGYSLEKCNYSIGLESGLFRAPGTNSGYLEACICAIYDGLNFAIGLSPGFEIPSFILKYILENQMDLGQACYYSGFTTNQNLGSAEGMIGLLTNMRITRKIYTKQSLITALMQIEKATIYQA